MLKRLNFTERHRITRDLITIRVKGTDSRVVHFAVDLSDAHLRSDAVVVLEVTSAGLNVVERIPCGTVSQWDRLYTESPESIRYTLTELSLRELKASRLIFAIKVVDRTEQIGRIIGLAGEIRVDNARDAYERQSLLPVMEAPISGELWRLDFGVSCVMLLVNENIPELVERLRTDPLCYSLIYPQIVRKILTKAIQHGVYADDDDCWETRWQQFGKQLHPEHENPPENMEEDGEKSWVDEVVEAFCQKHAFEEKCHNSLTQEVKS